MNQETKIYQNYQRNFTIELKDFKFYEKNKVLREVLLGRSNLISSI